MVEVWDGVISGMMPVQIGMMNEGGMVEVWDGYIGWYDENSVGGMEACCTKLLDADPNCVLGNVLVHGLDVMGTGRSIYRDPEFKANMDNIVKLAETPSVTPREKLHVEGITAWAYGEIDKAQIKWEEILLKHPTDMLALKFAHDSYFYMGYSAQMRDSLARVLPYWRVTLHYMVT
uniref:Tetratricopeptide repeat protein 38-like n=1 Tax=Saccoglossus kowalevskii TaxID=10224 RepID=A0ABM0MK30_SACKO|nr:PREDICTED: tetratricopeptide repeat protein 38-like [Saccoglossus kowalevskii]